MCTRLFAFLFFMLAQATLCFAQHNIIPIPVSYTTTNDVFIFDDNLSFNVKTNNVPNITG